jgi:hypothetical protein
MNMPNSPKAIIARAVRQMSPELRAQYDSLRRLLASATTNDVRARYRIGQVVAEIKTREDRYGARAVPLLAAALGRDETTLYRYASVAETWDEGALEELLLKRMPMGEPISWSHLLELATVRSPEARARLLNETLVRGLSVRALAAMARGVPPIDLGASPARSLSQLERIVRTCAVVEKRFTLNDRVLAELADQNPSLATSLLDRAMAAQERALRAIETSLKKLKRAESRLGVRAAKRLQMVPPAKQDSFPRLLVGMA